jgi:putative ABC transport system permease protein
MPRMLSPLTRFERTANLFFLTYLRRELSRRMRQAAFITVGLAVGIGLVVTVTAASTGVNNAQAAVLHSLYGIGTNITVTEAPPPPSHQSAFSPGSTAQQVDILSVGALGLLNESSVTVVARLQGVKAVAGGLILTNQKLTIPSQKDLGPDGQLPPSAFPTTFTVDGVDLTHAELGPLGSGQIISGRIFATADAASNVAVVDSNYATKNNLTVGSIITLAKTPFSVIGIVRQPQGGGSADVYLPLGRAQALTQFQDLKNLTGKVNVIYVAAASAADVDAVQAKITKLLPSATVTTATSLANAVSGSLATAASLIDALGRWLAIAVLLAAFAVASLLTIAAVARRVREFGTLKALGWRSRRIIAQVMAESLVVGVVGAIMGIALGFGGAALVNAVAPTLSATVSQNPGSPPPQDVTINGSGMHLQAAPGSTSTVIVHLTAQVTAGTLVLAVILAIAGALIAGAFGSWRAARMRPAEALAQVA